MKEMLFMNQFIHCASIVYHHLLRSLAVLVYVIRTHCYSCKKSLADTLNS